MQATKGLDRSIAALACREGPAAPGWGRRWGKFQAAALAALYSATLALTSVLPAAAQQPRLCWRDNTSDIDLDPLARDEGQVGADGSFTIDGLFGRRVFRVAGLPADWQMTAIRQGRSDITSSGIDLAPGTAIEISIVVAQR